MKLQVGDKVLVTGGKDRGKKSEVVLVLPKSQTVIVKDVNMYTRHVKPYGERAGEKVRRERPLPLSKVAILNDKGQPDRVGYQLTKGGIKTRIYKKTGKAIPAKAVKSAKKREK
jgi:large subunit ribosomal protein L24